MNCTSVGESARVSDFFFFFKSLDTLKKSNCSPFLPHQGTEEQFWGSVGNLPSDSEPREASEYPFPLNDDPETTVLNPHPGMHAVWFEADRKPLKHSSSGREAWLLMNYDLAQS